MKLHLGQSASQPEYENLALIFSVFSFSASDYDMYIIQFRKLNQKQESETSNN